MSDRDVLAALLRTDFRYFTQKAFHTIVPGTPFLPNWHISAIAYALVEVHQGKVRRLLILQPPRSLKSICASVAYPAWRLGHNPSQRIIVASYSTDFAAELHRQFRRIVDSDWYQKLFPDMRVARDSGTELITTMGGSRYATSVGGTLTGRGADLIIVDDPHKAEEANSEPARRRVIDWYGGTLVTRLNSKETGSIIVVMQRLHEDDLAGHNVELGAWHKLELPAIATEDSIIPIGPGKAFTRRRGDVLHPARESREVLDRIKAEIGSLRFSAQYQQQPLPLEGNLLKRFWFVFYDQLPAKTSRSRIVQSWDVASMLGDANDYSVCTTWHVSQSDYYLIDVFRARLEYPFLRRKVISLAARHKATTILIEKAGSGISLLQELQRNTPSGTPRPIGRKPEGNKVERMGLPSAKIEAGHVHLPRDAEWLADFLIETLAFPYGKHDDQVDSVSQFLNWVESSLWNDIDIGSPISIPNDFYPP